VQRLPGCRVDRIVWKRADEQEIRDGASNVTDFGRRLTIRDVRSSDAATYTCTAHYKNHVDASDTGGPTATHDHRLTVKMELSVRGGESTKTRIVRHFHALSVDLQGLYDCRCNDISVAADNGMIRGGSMLLKGGTCPPTHIPPRIQKLADLSDVISEVPKCSKIQIFLGSTPDPVGEAYSAPQTP